MARAPRRRGESAPATRRERPGDEARARERVIDVGVAALAALAALAAVESALPPRPYLS
ncbi:hypothetical protein AB3662_35370 [Sorangium cellulosum]|uniref:hypothetical protein n=1 Tax=Sorangium cellulosum TaxID=56 RepID=UPI003D9A4E9C